MRGRVQTARRAFTLLEMSLVICVLLVLISVSFMSSGWLKSWRLGRTASESLRTVYVAQRTYLADNPTAQVANITSDMLLPYMPNNTNALPVITSLTGGTLNIRVNVSPPYVTEGPAASGTRYDPSNNNTDSLWDVGE